MRSSLWLLCTLLAAASHAPSHAQALDIRAALSAPYATGLTAAPGARRFAWIEDAEGVHNLWAAAPGEPARALTHYTADDAQDIASLAWSPSGDRVAFVLGAELGQSGRPANPAHLQRPTPVEIWVAFADGSRPPVRVAEGRAPLWLPGGHDLAFIRSGTIWSAPVPDINPAQPSTPSDDTDTPHREPGTHQLVWDRGTPSSLTLSPDGRWLAYISHRRRHSFLALFDLRARVLRFVAPSTGVDSAPNFSSDSHFLAWIREPFTDAPEFAANRVSLNPWSIQLADLSTLGPGEAEPIPSRTVYQPTPGEPGSVIPRFATGNPRLWWAAGGVLLFCSEADTWVHLYGIRATDPAARERLLSPLSGEVEDVSLAPDGRSVLWASNQLPAGETPTQDLADIDRRHIWRLRLDDNAAPERLSSGTGIETRPLQLEDGSIVTLSSDPRLPMHPAWLRDTALADVRPNWLPPTYPAAAFTIPQPVIFPANFSAPATAAPSPHSPTPRSLTRRSPHSLTHALSRPPLPIHGQLFLPPGFTADRKWPAIVFFHGGPRRQMLLGYPAMDYYSNAYAMNQVLASRGFIVLSVNYRCGIGYGLDFRQCEHAGADGASEYQDALAAVRFLGARGDVDMSRVGIWGGSYGGYFTALGLARNSDLFRAGVDFHGVHDWTLEDNASTDWLRGSESEKDAISTRARASSPVADIARWRSPVLLIHGDDDPDVTFLQTPMLADRLRARGVHVEELIFPDELHGFVLHRDWLRAYEATAAFLTQQLQP